MSGYQWKETAKTMSVRKKEILGFALLGSLIFLFSFFLSALVLAHGSETIVSVDKTEVPPGGYVKLPVMVRNVSALGAGSVCITYDSSLVHVIDVTEGKGNALLIGAWNSNNSVNPGYVRIASYSAWVPGQTGEVVFAEVTFQAVGAANNTSALNISVESLFNVGYLDILSITQNGSLTILETSVRSFDTGNGGYPSISGTYTGSIKSNRVINVSTLYTYALEGTGGHAEYAGIWNGSNLMATATWAGYTDDWHNLSFNRTICLQPEETYHYEIRTGSYAQVIHEATHPTLDGSLINCTSFVDDNGNIYDDWIPAIKLYKDEGDG